MTRMGVDMALMDRLIGPFIDRRIRALMPGGDGMLTHSGQRIDADSPFQLVPVRAAINVLAQDVATLPLKLYRKDGRGRVEETGHPLSNCLKLAPNPRMTAFEYREALMVSLLTWGNAYAYLQRDETQRVVALWPLRPDKMTVTLEDGRLVYTYKSEDAESTFPAFDILHVKGLSGDGLVGRTPLYDYLQKLGEIKAMEKFSQSFYGNGMKRGAVLKHPGPGAMSDKAYDRLKKDVAEKSGVQSGKTWSTLILEEGMDFAELTFAPEDAQLLETRRFGVEDACRIFNLPPYKLRIVQPGAVSYASVDAQSIDYLVSTLTPWLVRIEQAVARACLTLKEREAGYFVEHNTRALLRSDLKSQAEALEIERRGNIITINEGREFLGLNPHTDERADDLFAPTNVQATVSPAE